MSIVVTIEVTTPPGGRDELVERLMAILADTRAFEGCESVHLATDPNDATKLVLVERWTSAERYDAYRAWRAESGTSVLATDLVVGKPNIAIYDIVG